MCNRLARYPNYATISRTTRFELGEISLFVLQAFIHPQLKLLVGQSPVRSTVKFVKWYEPVAQKINLCMSSRTIVTLGVTNKSGLYE